MTPAAALVPKPTPASTQSHGADTISTSLLKSVPGAVEGGNEGPTRRPSPAPAHNLKTAGPRVTPSPSSPPAADFDPQAPKNSLDPHDTAPDPLLPLSVPSSGLLSSLTDPNTLSNSQNKTSANIQAAFRNQTAFASKSKSPSTVGGPVRASSSPISAVLPYKSGDEKSISFRPMRKLISFASDYFAFFLW